MTGAKPMLVASDLRKTFRVRSSTEALGADDYRARHVDLRAVDGVSLEVRPGEILGIVGESGCGKTTLGLIIARLEDPSGGELRFDGVDLLSLPEKKLRAFRTHFQMVFQDPYSSLNPRMRVGRILSEAIRVHGVRKEADIRARVTELLRLVEMLPEAANRYPAHLSAGQRQRVGIARALAVNPRLIIADEPVSSLDVSVQAQILNLIKRLRRELGVAWIFVGHNLSVVHYIADRIAVMYLGRIVEEGPADAVFGNPQHPYTRGLLESVPEPDPEMRLDAPPLQGDPPSPTRIPPGCRFAARCALSRPYCNGHDPQLQDVERDHRVACWAVTEQARWAASATSAPVG